MNLLRVIILITFLSLIASDQIEIIDKILKTFSDKSPKDQFKVWHLLFEKTYDLATEEAKLRFKNFKENLAFIKEHNSNSNDSILGLNEFSDMSHEEFNKIYLDQTFGDNFQQATSLQEKFQLSAEPEIDASVMKNSNGIYPAIDWRSYLLAPRNQGQCGSCWAFANNGAVEGNRAITFPDIAKVYLSTQQLLDCDTRNYGCNGGNPDLALKYTQKNGLTDENSYPYKTKQGNCNIANLKNIVSKISDYKYCYGLKCAKNDGFYNLLKQGPVIVAIDASDSVFSYYKSGVMRKLKCKGPNHAINVVGYGIVNTTNIPYWIIRNSWGTSWGQNGYGYVEHDDSNKNSCFMNNQAWLPLPSL